MRPSSGAETLENEAACGKSDTEERAEVAAAEDGRTPVNRCAPSREERETLIADVTRSLFCGPLIGAVI